MASALGTLAIIEKVAAVGPVFHMRCSLTGDANYGGASGGTAGLLAAVKAALGDANVNIIAVKDQSLPSTVSALEYNHTTDKLLARVRTSGVESVVDDQHAITYGLYIVAG